MKKLMYLISAIAGTVGLSTAANADISVSGAGGLAVVNDGAASDNAVYDSASVAFALSATTSNGLGISMGMGISESSGGNTTTVTGGDAVTFTTGGATIVVGVVDTVGTVGGVGGVNSDWVDNSTIAADASTDIAVTSGEGFTLSTAMGGATLTVGYVADGAAGDGIMNLTDSDDTSAGATISMPMGNMTVSVGFANADTAAESETHVGGTVALAAGGGTLTVGMGQASLAGGDATSMGATYAMSLDADTSLSVGYNNTKDADHNDTTTELSLSRSLGGGASVFFDVLNVSGDADTNALGTAFAIGSSFSF
jgi:hypothetical protein